MKKRALRLIVTGFDPFAGGKFNPSGELAQLFPDLITIKDKGECAVERLLLPTCCDSSWKVLHKKLKKFADEDLVLVMTGLAEGRLRLSLERVALNLQDYRVADNNGHKHEARKIDSKNENALFTTLPVDKIKKALIKKGVPCDVSNHAGAFVCNDLYFRALSYQNKHEHLKAALFIHVPLPKDFASTLEKTKPAPELKSFDAKKLSKKRHVLRLMQESVELALLESVKHMGSRAHL